MFRTSLAAIGFAVCIFSGAEAKADSISVDESAVNTAGACPNNLPDSSPELLCICQENAAVGSVWGSGPYTADSRICSAARHAGAVGLSGGPVLVLARDGQDSYEGSDANGISTRRWGSYGRSIEIVQVSVGAALETCGRLPAGVDQYACSCPADDGRRGAIYGAGPYTADSDICTAAMHDGAIGREGGDVTVLRMGGLSNYANLEANGVTPQAWGSYSASIVFDRNQ